MMYKTVHFYYCAERDSIVKALGAAAVLRPLYHIALRSKQFKLMENCILPECLNAYFHYFSIHFYMNEKHSAYGF